jgi:hypothetical protein
LWNGYVAWKRWSLKLSPKLLHTFLPHLDTTLRSKTQLFVHTYTYTHIQLRRKRWSLKQTHVYQLNNIIQSNILSETVTYGSIDTVAEADGPVNYERERDHEREQKQKQEREQKREQNEPHQRVAGHC